MSKTYKFAVTTDQGDYYLTDKVWVARSQAAFYRRRKMAAAVDQGKFEDVGHPRFFLSHSTRKRVRG